MKEKEFKELKLTKNIIIPFPNFQQNTIISPTQMNDNFEEIEHAYNNLIDNHNGAITKINEVLTEITSNDNEAIINEQARIQAEEIRVQNEEQRISNEDERKAEEKKRIAMYNVHLNDELRREQKHIEMINTFDTKIVEVNTFVTAKDQEVQNAINAIPPKSELIGDKGDNGDKGDKGEQGERGEKGEKGDNGITPNIKVGRVITLEPTEQANVERVGTLENPIFNFYIPRGLDGSGEGSGDWHTHTNLSALNSITQTKINEWDDKAPSNHSHTEYASNSHTHSNYASKSHTHSDYANKTHTHSEYASSNHTHNYANTSHTHNTSDISNLNNYISDLITKNTYVNSLKSTIDTLSSELAKVKIDIETLKNNSGSNGGGTNGGGGSNSGGSGGTTTSGIKVEPASISIEIGKTADIIMLFGNDVTNKNIEYMSSNGAIASVSDLGSYKYRITGVGQGNTMIRFRTSDGKFETSCSVTVTSGSTGGGSTINEEYIQSCTSEYILDKMYPMGQAHEAIPSGNITGWKYNSRWENQDRPYAMPHSCGQSGCPGTGAFQALGCWSNIYRVEGTSFTKNTAVEMKDIKVYGWYNGAWELVQHLPVPNGGFYAESFSGDANRYFGDSVKESGTSRTIILREANKINSENCMYHPFSNVRAFDTKYQYIYACIDLRKVKWDESGIDDRDQTHYCSNCGGDWWLAEGLMFHDSWQHNKGVCQPKMIEITKEWRRFSMTTVPQSWSNGFPK